jgi:hypothetical protein
VDRGQAAAGGMANLYVGQGNALAGIQADKFNFLSANRGALADAMINRETNRSNIATQAGTAAQSTIGNALADAAIAKGNAWQMGAQGVANGLQNGLTLGRSFGVF